MINSVLVEHSGMNGAPGSVLLIAILWVFYESAESVLVKTPTDTTVIANQSTFFNCSKSGNKSEQLTWHHYAVDGKAEGVYETGSIRGAYKGRFDIDINITSGSFNLLVQRPELSDAGRYACVEDPLEKDPGASAELTVLDSDLVCEADMVLHEVIGSTQCDKTIPSDEPLLSCRVTYSGNIAPQMEWRNAEMASEYMKPECNTAGNRIMCNSTPNANLIKDGAVFVCQLATAKKYNCSLKVNKTIYTFSDNSVRNITLTDEASCSANTSAELPCSYKWYKGNQTEQIGQTLKTNKSGIYRCEAECIIRNETCAFTAKKINVLESGDEGENEVSSRRHLLILVVIPAVIILVVGAVVLWRKYRKTAEINQATTPMLSDVDAVYPKSVKTNTGHEGRLLLEPLAVKEEATSTKTQEEIIVEIFSKGSNLLRHGLNAEIHGPFSYKDMDVTCMYERIMCAKNSQKKTDISELSEEETVCVNGLKWMALNHKNLIKVFDVCLVSPAVYIVMEFATGESIRESLDKRTEDLPIEVIRDWTTQLAQGLSHLHENGNGIVHKNVESREIFIVESPDRETTLKISCFNLYGIKSVHMSRSATKNFAIWPPEQDYTEQYDVWSFGIVIWEMLTGTEPYQGMKSRADILTDINNGAKHLKIPARCTEELQEILHGCRRVKPSERLSFGDILQLLKR